MSRRFARSTPTPTAQCVDGVDIPIPSAATTSDSPSGGTSGDGTPGSTGRKRKAVGTDNLVEFVKDFNIEYSC